jgi:hypothetical protein
MIYDADTAYAISRAIGENAEAVNGRNLGIMLGYVQNVLAAHLCLSLTKIFERQKHNAIRSIWTTLNFLERRCPWRVKRCVASRRSYETCWVRKGFSTWRSAMTRGRPTVIGGT